MFNLLFLEQKMTVCMEFLEGFDLLDHVLTDHAGDYHPDVATGLGEFMGTTHALTHSQHVDATRKAYLVKHFENRAMRDIQLEFVFTKCYKEATDEQRAGLQVNEAFLQEIELLKRQYNGDEDATQNLVLCHGDLHPGSVMVDKAGSVKVIDPEFTGKYVKVLRGIIYHSHILNSQQCMNIIMMSSR
jgi:5-methylthioribose kinase